MRKTTGRVAGPDGGRQILIRRSSTPTGKRARELFSQSLSHCRAALRCSISTRLDALLSERVESLLGKLAVAGNRRAGTCRTHRTWLDRSDHCRGAHGRSRSSAFAGPVDDRTTRAGRGDSSKPAAAYICIRKLSVCSQPMQRYVISSNLGLRGSERINLIFLPHVVHGSSATRKFAQVGVGREVGCIVASRIGGYATQRT